MLMNRRAALRLAGHCAGHALTLGTLGAAPTKPLFHRGVSFTAERGARYGSPESIEMLRQLPSFGVNSIALIPYGFMPRDGSFAIRTAGQRSWESDDGVRALAAEAHRLKIAVMLKPHVWRLNDRKDAPPGWLDQYLPFIGYYARLATEIQAASFCVGVEYQSLSPQEKAWRRIIARARTLYKGPLTYAANFGHEFESIAFWNALDFIGLDNYYPLGPNYSAAAILDKVHGVHQRFRKPIVFTEAGFSAADGAHKTPWADHPPSPLSLNEQRKCYEATLSTFFHQTWFRGVYWWKVGTNGYGGPQDNSMTPWRKPAMDVIKRYYLNARR
jgi:hypothetical protein